MNQFTDFMHRRRLIKLDITKKIWEKISHCLSNFVILINKPKMIVLQNCKKFNTKSKKFY